jgi:hypothetical protein
MSRNLNEEFTVDEVWQSLMTAAGASFDASGRVGQFRAPAVEVRAAAQGTVLCELSGLSLIRARGADAQTFLQSQLSNDIRLVDTAHSQLSAYNTPKGRMLALFRVFRRGDDYLLQLPHVRAEETLKRLRMFVMRSRVTLDLADAELARIGVSGPEAADRLRATLGEVPIEADTCETCNEVTVLCLAGPNPRFELVAPIATLATLWNQLAAQTTVCGPVVWRWLDIMAGIPSVLPGAVEEFVPQMVNLELINGVSFKKGCYPGQEIVARMQYLGQLKRRMYRLHSKNGEICPAPGAAVYAPDLGEQAAGHVVDAVPAPAGGCDLLAVVTISSVGKGALSLDKGGGRALRLGTLPYPLAGGGGDHAA